MIVSPAEIRRIILSQKQARAEIERLGALPAELRELVEAAAPFAVCGALRLGHQCWPVCAGAERARLAAALEAMKGAKE